MRGVMRALTSSSPRADDTRTQSPDSTPSFWASVLGNSSTGSGISSLSQGMFRVVDPAHQCSATVDVISTYGNLSTVPIGWCDATRGYLTIGLVFTLGCRTFSTGLST